MDLGIDWASARAPAPQLCLLWHAEGANGASMGALAQALRQAFPDAAIVAPELPSSNSEHNWPSWQPMPDGAAGAALDAELAVLHRWVQAMQLRAGAGPAATSIYGFSRGAMLALELAQRHDGLAGRVLSFGGAYARWPAHAPRETTLHLLHGAADEIVPADHVRQTLQRLAELQGDATLDLAQGVGHLMHPALIDQALHRLRAYIPHRTWQAALGAASHPPSH